MCGTGEMQSEAKILLRSVLDTTHRHTKLGAIWENRRRFYSDIIQGVFTGAELQTTLLHLSRISTHFPGDTSGFPDTHLRIVFIFRADPVLSPLEISLPHSLCNADH